MEIESRRHNRTSSITHYRAYENEYDSNIDTFSISTTFASCLSTRFSNYSISATDSKFSSSGEESELGVTTVYREFVLAKKGRIHGCWEVRS